MGKDIMMGQFSLALFDLGGVVYRTDSQVQFERWAEFANDDPERLKCVHKMDAMWEDFERGKVSGEAYHRHLCDVLDIELTYDQFIVGWNAIYYEPFDIVLDCLNALKGRCKVMALTNTNEVHCQAWMEKYADSLPVFDEVFISSRIGMRKPDREIYAHVLEVTGVAAEETVFFDDLAENLKSAGDLGITGVQVGQPEDVKAALREYGMI